MVVVLFLVFVIFILYYIRDGYINNNHQTKSQQYHTKEKISIPNNDKKNNNEGLYFEEYCIELFDDNYFTIIEWRSDKYINGRYAKSNHNPDLEVQLKKGKVTFAVECKYRSKIYSTILLGQNYNFYNYKKFSLEKNMPVFVILGLAGSPKSPKEIYIIPLKDINSNAITYTNLKKYKRYNNHKKFFFNSEEMELT